MRMPPLHSAFEVKYQLEEILGEGGFAIVYRALDVRTERRVAIKILKPEVNGYSPGTEARFMREVRVIASLRDPHTITMFEFGQTAEGLLFMVFEYIPGRDLADLLRGAGRLDARATTHVLCQVLRSLREAHAAGLLHRDIKPENIRIFEYMGDPLTVKVLDFGIARSVDAAEGAITRTGAAVGTPRYMSPEQMLGVELTASSDIYSLGMVGFEMLVGRGLVNELNQPSEQLKRLTTQKPIEFPPDTQLPDELRVTLRRMLCVTAEERFQSAGEILQALEGGARPPMSMPEEMFAAAALVAPTLVKERASPTLAEPEPVSAHTTARPPPGAPVRMIAVGVLSLFFVFAALFGALMALREPPPVQPADLESVKPAAANVAVATRLPFATDVGIERVEPDVGTLPIEAPTGCGKPAPFSGARLKSKMVVLDQLTWLTYVPESYDPERKHPVLMLFHTDFQGPEMFFEQSGFREIADREGLVVIAPDGGQMSPWRTGGEIVLVDAAFEETSRALCLDRDRVFAVGFGNGARVVERMPCEYPVTAISSLSWRPKVTDKVCVPETPLPYIQISGTKNKFNPVKGGIGCNLSGRQISLRVQEENWRERNQCSKPARRYARKCRTWACEGAPYVSCLLGGGLMFHVEVPVFPECIGPQPKYPVAETVWKFFEKNSPSDTRADDKK